MPNWKENVRGVEAILKENDKLVKKGVWDVLPVEWARVSAGARAKGEVVHRARVFGLVTIKGSDLPEAEQKVKGRLVFGGDNITTNHYEMEGQFGEASSSPAAIAAYRTAVLMGHRAG